MKKYIILWLLCCFALLSWSQGKETCVSLWQIWNDTSLPDSNRQAAVQKLSDSFYSQQPDSIHYLLNRHDGEFAQVRGQPLPGGGDG